VPTYGAELQHICTGLIAGDPEPAVKHAVKTAKADHASCRLVFLCSSHAGEALAHAPALYCRQTRNYIVGVVAVLP
jgi:hypothetical protein